MQEEHGDRVVTISWNVDHDQSEADPAEPLQRAIVEKLRQLKVSARNVIAREPIRQVLDHYGIFGLPATLVFGPDGQLAQRFEGAFTIESDVAPLVRDLLKQGE